MRARNDRVRMSPEVCRTALQPASCSGLEGVLHVDGRHIRPPGKWHKDQGSLNLPLYFYRIFHRMYEIVTVLRRWEQI